MKNKFEKILFKELIPSTGCTEPIAIAFAAAICRKVLNRIPDRVIVKLSGSIIKNAHSAKVPNTGMAGIKAAVAAGIIAGDESANLEVLSEITKEELIAIEAYLQRECISLIHNKNGHLFDIVVSANGEEDEVSVHIIHNHLNVCEVTKNGHFIYKGGKHDESNHNDIMTVKEIIEYADSIDVSSLNGLIEAQITANMNIANEGLKAQYGTGVGKMLWEKRQTVNDEAVAMVAAGVDARMGGCPLPVVIVCGSGNQGITVSVPLIIHAKHAGFSNEQLIRALVVGNLIAVHIKSGIGCLSAFCGAVCAGAAVAAGIAYLYGGSLEVIGSTIINTLAIASGNVCDGAKGSCAAKVSICVQAGFLGWEMACSGLVFKNGEGIVKDGVEETILAIARLGRSGMKQTDEEILRIMLDAPELNCF